MPRKRAFPLTHSPLAPQTLSRLILERIGEAGEVLLSSFFPAKYPEARLWRNILGLDHAYEFKRPTFASLLYQLKSQGLVASAKRRGRTHWRLTSLGQSALRSHPKPVSPPDGKRRLVCFDILEQERAKRRWLRAELIAHGFRQLQKSVWIGDVPLPPDFIKGLDDLGLRGRVHILSIESKGTLV